jgi:hypothetical protein
MSATADAPCVGAGTARRGCHALKEIPKVVPRDVVPPLRDLDRLHQSEQFIDGGRHGPPW